MATDLLPYSGLDDRAPGAGRRDMGRAGGVTLSQSSEEKEKGQRVWE